MATVRTLRSDVWMVVDAGAEAAVGLGTAVAVGGCGTLVDGAAGSGVGDTGIVAVGGSVVTVGVGGAEAGVVSITRVSAGAFAAVAFVAGFVALDG